MRILIIEDEFNLADVIANRLKKEKYAVDIICDGEEGLEIVLQYQLRRIVTFLKSLFEPYHMLLYQLCNHLLIKRINTAKTICHIISIFIPFIS